MRSAGDSGEATTRPEPRLPERYGTTGNLKKKRSCGRGVFSSWDWIGRTDSVLRLWWPLTATCGHSWPLGKRGHSRPLDKSGHLRPLGKSGDSQPLAAARVAASGCKWLFFRISNTTRFVTPMQIILNNRESLRTWRFYCLWYVHNTMDHSSDLQSLDTERTLSCLISTIHSSNNI